MEIRGLPPPSPFPSENPQVALNQALTDLERKLVENPTKSEIRTLEKRINQLASQIKDPEVQELVNKLMMDIDRHEYDPQYSSGQITGDLLKIKEQLKKMGGSQW